uniref:Uncharacterized protein n=1 Tax=Plectus sambesii TaxID=2011161 RepID=A0A914W3Y0_9BILA
MSTSKASLVILIIALAVAPPVEGGPALGTLCVTACNAGVVTCYTAAGLVFGTVTAGIGAWPAVAGCSLAQGACMATCAVSFVTPTI